MGLLLDPCRDRDYDCCSDHFGEPVRLPLTSVSIR
jgi:hypothetical protein